MVARRRGEVGERRHGIIKVMVVIRVIIVVKPFWVERPRIDESGRDAFISEAASAEAI